MSTGQRLGIFGAIIVVGIVAIVIAGSSSKNSAPASVTTTIDVRNSRPVGGVKQIKVKKGGTLNLTVNSDTADEIHIHATDQHADVKKGGSIHLTVKPQVAGTSEIELENHNVKLADVVVEP